MPSYFGTSPISKFYFGSDSVSKVYIGSVEIYSEGGADVEALNVSGAGVSACDGKYTKTGTLLNNLPQYTNGTYYIQTVLDDDNVLAWVITDNPNKYNDSGTFPGVFVHYYSITGILGTWLVGSAGTTPAPTVEELFVGRLSVSSIIAPPDAMGYYLLVDSSAAGDDRIWKHTQNNYYISRGTSAANWYITTSATRPTSPVLPSGAQRFITSSSTEVNPYASDGSSLSWGANSSASGSPSVILDEIGV